MTAGVAGCAQDLTRDVLRIDAIPSTSLDGVREWLTSMDIKFYENKARARLRLARCLKAGLRRL